MNKLKNNRGFSLIQVIVALALTSILTLGLMGVMRNSLRSQKGIETTSTANDVFSRVASYIRNNEICTMVFGESKPGQNIQLFEINAAGTGSSLSEGMEIGNSGIIVEDKGMVILKNPTDVGNGIYELTFSLALRKDGKSSDFIGAGTTIVREFTFMAELCRDIDSLSNDGQPMSCYEAEERCEMTDSIGNETSYVFECLDQEDDYILDTVFTCSKCSDANKIKECKN